MKKSVLQRDSPLRRWDGPLTAELTLRPGDFGLGKVPARLAPDAVTSLVCGFCSVGCSLQAHLQNGHAISLTPDPEYPVNLGLACPKGWEALAPLAAPDRATTPLLRNQKTQRFDPVDWDHALQVFTLKFKALLDQHGPESIAFLSSGQICTEEMALLGALFKFGMGGLHCDSNTRQCMATSHVAYKQSFGFDAPPYTYADLEESDVLIFIGSNLCVAHPILWQRVLRNPNRPEIIVIDPRKTETAMNATQHLAIAPKSDLVLLYGAARALIRRGCVQLQFVDAHTVGFEDFVRFLDPFTREMVCAATGLSCEAFARFVTAIAGGRAVSFWWTMGVNQGHEATRTAQAVINLALMTANIGRPGTGANSITGQCNAMGSRLFSNTTTLLSGRSFANAEHRLEVGNILGIPVERIPTHDSQPYHQIVQRIEEGTIKGLWIIGTNPSHSWIDQKRFNEGLSQLEFLVVQDLYHSTETARQADLILPAAGWGEKEGTFINSERRIGLVKKIARAPGQALADFHIFQLIAHYWGCGPMFAEWSSPPAAFQVLKKLSKDQPCDITGIRDYRMLEESGGIQWPCPGRASVPPDESAPLRYQTNPRECRLFEDGRFYHPDGKARFIFEQPRESPERANAEYPLLLITGRGTAAQWHTLTRSGKSDILRRLQPDGLQVEIHPADAARLRVRPHTRVRVFSRRGSIYATAMVTPTVQQGQVFMPMHYEETNQLTLAAFDPHSYQPAYKYCAVCIEPS